MKIGAVLQIIFAKQVNGFFGICQNFLLIPSHRNIGYRMKKRKILNHEKQGYPTFIFFGNGQHVR
jgi:hypothetical protein